jgi:hypothetical protein
MVLAEPVPSARRRRSLLLAATVGTLALAVVALVVALLTIPGSVAPGGDPYSAVDNGLTGPSPVDDPSVSGVGSSGRPAHPSGTPTGRPIGTPSPSAGAVASLAPPAGADISAVYSLQQTWPGGFIARVLLTNAATTGQSWQIAIEYPSTVTRYVTGWSNGSNPPTTTTSGQRSTITGPAPLGAGQSVAVFVQYDDQGTDIGPTSCSVNGSACTLT